MNVEFSIPFGKSSSSSSLYTLKQKIEIELWKYINTMKFIQGKFKGINNRVAKITIYEAEFKMIIISSLCAVLVYTLRNASNIIGVRNNAIINLGNKRMTIDV
jgi:hypothetical protein